VLAAHPAPAALDFRAVDYTLPTAVLLGTEETGVTEEAAAAADGWIAIPMSGMVTSLNVSVAAALILFEAQRQREAAGLYAASRLPADAYTRRRKKVAYPPLGPDGEILGEIPRS
jgi:tRNA (guanosine-2'-O-)-methyltransferase